VLDQKKNIQKFQDKRGVFWK